MSVARPPLDLIVQRGLTPRESLAADRELLDGAREGRAALRVYELDGEVLSIGRYHLAPAARADGGVAVCRRRSGGRAAPCGAGFVGLSLVLPHRSWLEADDPLALAPEQVMNRCVRGLLEACELSGAAAIYPGRDTITVQRRLLGLVSFEVEASGALLFEAVLACSRDFSVLPLLLDHADPAGTVKGGMLTAEDTTSLARVTGRALDTAAVADRLRKGYERRLGVRFAERTFGAVPPFDDAAWLRERRLRPGIDRHASLAIQLGLLEAHLEVDQERIVDVVLAGDFIANSSAIERLERDLRGCQGRADAVEAAVAGVFAAPENFILGVGPAQTVADAIVRALAT